MVNKAGKLQCSNASVGIFFFFFFWSTVTYYYKLVFLNDSIECTKISHCSNKE